MGGLDGEPQGSPVRSRSANLSCTAHPVLQREAVLQMTVRKDRAMQVSQATTPPPVNTCYSLFGENPVDILNAFDTAAKTFASIGVLIDGVRDTLSIAGDDEADSLLSSAAILASRHGAFLSQYTAAMQETMEGGVV